LNIKLFGRIIFISKTTLLVITVIITAVLMVSGNLMLNNKPNKDLVVSSEESGDNNISSVISNNETPVMNSGDVNAERIFVYIVGAVKNPGLYEIDKNTLVYDIINTAGGLKPEADMNYINMAQKININSMLKVLTEKERKEQQRQSALLIVIDNIESTVSAEDQNDSRQSGKININTAGKSELTVLPGIGDKRAQDIITYRQTSGAFKKIEDIMLVNGIKESIFNSIKDLIIV